MVLCLIQGLYLAFFWPIGACQWGRPKPRVSLKPEVKLRIEVLYNEASSNTRKQQENNNHRYQESQRSLALIVGNTDANCLHLRVIVKSVRTQLSTHAGLFEATEWHLVVEGIVVVNPHRTIFPMLILAEWPKNW